VKRLNTVLLIIIAGVLGLIAYQMFLKEDPCVTMRALERQLEETTKDNALLGGFMSQSEEFQKKHDKARFACQRSLGK
jgi:hypothetical protein